MRGLITAVGMTLSMFAVSVTAGELSVNGSRAVVVSGPIMGSLDSTAKAMHDMSVDKKHGEEPIDLILDSPGGSVISGFAFINAMEAIKERGTPIRCFVKDMAASMAFGIFLHCSERHALSRSLLLWHRARVGGMGEPITAPLATQLAEALQSADDVILEETISVLSKDMSEGDIERHFEAQTLHIASNLGRLLPHVLQVHSTIPGLYEAFYAKKKDVNIFDLLFGGGGRKGNTPLPTITPEMLYAPGTILYVDDRAFSRYIEATK